MNQFLPLLYKELVEQASRRRTYIVRVVYASLLFLFGFVFYFQIVGQYDSSNPFAVLGRGRELFMRVLYVQFAGIYLFMPALSCGAITVEKERSSLALLLLTKLGPWTIILEKFMGRVIPMFTFLILSLPLLVFAYALGGVSQTLLWTGVWFLALSTVHIGSLALLCSAFFRSTVASFIATYLFGILMVVSVPFVNYLFDLQLPQLWNELMAVNSGREDMQGYWINFMFFPPAIFFFLTEVGIGWVPTATPVIPTAASSLFRVASVSSFAVVSTLIMLVLTRFFLVRRAFLPASNFLLRVFKGIDRFFFWLNNNPVTRGKVLISDNSALDEIAEPVAWRETTKTSLGSLRYLIRLFLLLETPIVAVGLITLALDGVPGLVGAVSLIVWVMVMMIIAVKTATLISSERSRETLDVLLTTPMRSQEIVSEKFRGVTRLMWVLSVPLLTSVLLNTILYEAVQRRGRNSYFGSSGSNADWLIYGICGVATIAIYLPMVAWLSLFIGLKVRSQTKAIFTIMSTLVAWCVLPGILVTIAAELVGMRMDPNDPSVLFYLLSPAMIIPMNEFYGYGQYGMAAMIINCTIYGSCLLFFRFLCLSNLDDRLERPVGLQT